MNLSRQYIEQTLKDHKQIQNIINERIMKHNNFVIDYINNFFDSTTIPANDLSLFHSKGYNINRIAANLIDCECFGYTDGFELKLENEKIIYGRHIIELELLTDFEKYLINLAINVSNVCNKELQKIINLIEEYKIIQTLKT